MGNRRRFQEFLRKQEAATAYKRALADASDSLKKIGSLPVAVRPRPHSALVSKTVPRLARTRFAHRPRPHCALVHAKQCRGTLDVPLRPRCAARVRASEPTAPCCLLAQSTFRSSADGSILLDVSLTHRSAHEQTETASARREPSTRPGLRARTHTQLRQLVIQGEVVVLCMSFVLSRVWLAVRSKSKNISPGQSSPEPELRQSARSLRPLPMLRLLVLACTIVSPTCSPSGCRLLFTLSFVFTRPVLTHFTRPVPTQLHQQ
jgi:hypothetical protein